MIDKTGYSPYAATAVSGTAAARKSAGTVPGAEKPTAEQKQAALVQEIREKGFMNYVKEMQAKKIEELREKILQSMGLTEEDLAQMDSEQRFAIEDMIAREIRERMGGQAEGDEKGPVILNIMV